MSGPRFKLRRDRVTDPMQAWITLPLGEHWEVGYRLAVQHGRAVVSELHVRPIGRVPAGGLSARLLHQVRFNLYRTARDQVFGWFRKAGLTDLPGLGPLPAPPARARRGRKPLPDLFYAKAAAAYDAALQAHDPAPVRAVQRRLRLPNLERARDVLHRARRRGFLSASEGAGRAGGWLTPHATTLLKKGR